MTKRARWIVALMCFFVLAGCGLQIKKQNNTDMYYTALGFWQSTMDNFKLVYGEATEAERQDMLPAMELLLTTKKDVLNLWKIALVNNDDAGVIDKNAAWKKAKNQIILKVVKEFTEDKP